MSFILPTDVVLSITIILGTCFCPIFLCCVLLILHCDKGQLSIAVDLFLEMQTLRRNAQNVPKQRLETNTFAKNNKEHCFKKQAHISKNNTN